MRALTRIASDGAGHTARPTCSAKVSTIVTVYNRGFNTCAYSLWCASAVGTMLQDPMRSANLNKSVSWSRRTYYACSPSFLSSFLSASTLALVSVLSEMSHLESTARCTTWSAANDLFFSP